MATVGSDLTQIRKTIRRITRKLSTNEVPNADLDDAINTFLLYDFPSILKLIDLRRTFTFFTTPNIDTYYTNPNASSNDPMSDFKNLILSSEDPVFIDGYRSYFTLSEADFYRLWPKVRQKLTIGTGDGVTTNFSGTLTNIPVAPRLVLFSSIDANGVGQQLEDRPLVSATAGQLGVETINGNLYDPRGTVPQYPTVVIAANTINYKTGVYSITFSVAPAAGETVYAHVFPYAAGRPTCVLFYNNTFTVRPIPDDSYPVTVECYVRPTELLSATQEPELEQHWQFIAYGAAIKLMQWFTDTDTVAQLMPEFERQQEMVLNRTLEQMSGERSATIFSQAMGPYYGWNSRFFID